MARSAPPPDNFPLQSPVRRIRLAGVDCARYRIAGLSWRAAIDGISTWAKPLLRSQPSLSLVSASFAQPSAVKAQPYVYPPERVDWMVGPGYFGFSGYPWPGPPFAWPVLRPTYGCYMTRARLKNAWRQVEVCS